MFTFSCTPLSIVATIKSGFQLFRETFSKIWYWALLMTLISDIPNFLNMFMKETQNNTVIGIIFFTFGLISFLVSSFFSGFLFHRIYHLGIAPLSSEKASFNAAKEKWLRIVLAFIIAPLIWLPSLLIPLYVFTQIGMTAGFISLILPVFLGLLLGTLFILCVPLIMLDNQTAWRSLKKSASLVWGHWWKTSIIFGSVFIPMMICILTMQAIIPSLFLFTLLAGAISMIIFPLIDCLILVQFNNLKLIRKV